MDCINKNLIKFFVLISVFLIPFYFFRFSIAGVPTNIFEVFVVVSFLFTLIDFSCSLTIRDPKKISYWFSIFVVIAAASIFFSEDKIAAAGIFKGWFLIPFILFWIVINNFSKKNISILSIPLWFSLIVISKWAILQKLGFITTLFYQNGDQSFLQYLTEKRAFGPFESPNYLAMYLVPMIFLSLPIFTLVKNKLIKFIIIISYTLPLAAIYFSTSRGGRVALIASLVALVLFLYFKSKTLKKVVESLSNILIFALILVSIIILIYLVRNFTPNQGGDVIRLEIYNYAVAMIKDNYFFGIGLGDFQSAISQFSINNESFQKWGLNYALHPHNLYMAVWLNLGIAGLIAFFGMLWVTLKNIFSGKKEVFLRACLFASLIAILSHGLFDTTYFKNDLSAVFWLIAAMSFILARKNE